MKVAMYWQLRWLISTVKLLELKKKCLEAWVWWWGTRILAITGEGVVRTTRVQGQPQLCSKYYMRPCQASRKGRKRPENQQSITLWSICEGVSRVS